MSGPRDNRPDNRRASRPNSGGMAGRLAGLYGYDHYDLPGDAGTWWTVGQRSPIRFDGTYELTGTPSPEDWKQARDQYQREREQRLDQRADRLIESHPDLAELDRQIKDGFGDTEPDA